LRIENTNSATSTQAIATHAWRAILALMVVALAASCRSRAPATTVSVVDFIREFDRADRRPFTYTVVSSTAAGTTLAAIVGPVPGRLTWTLPLPRGGELRARVAATIAPVHVRLGVSDNRVYERLSEATIAPGAPWAAIAADLSRYAGWKPSLFYRPDRVQWRVVLSADAVSGPATVAWALPEIVAAPKDALEYATRAALIRNGAP
jgi:hypothetical protein